MKMSKTALSGGQAGRVGLARLEQFVRDPRGGVMLVSNDREFLARNATRVLGLELA
jgi:hypothetical protein